MKNTKTLLLFLCLIGIHQLHGAAGAQLEVTIGKDHYELPMGSIPFLASHDAARGCPLASNALRILKRLKTHTLLSSVFAYNPETTCVEVIKRMQVVTEEKYLELCDSNPASLRLYAIKRAGGGLFGLRVPASHKKRIKGELCSSALIFGYANVYLNKKHYDMKKFTKRPKR